MDLTKIAPPTVSENSELAPQDLSKVERFQILSLDGGGVKGIFSAAFLAFIEEDLGINVLDHFDLIAGTSTGGIIALALSLGMRPREIVGFYVNEGPKIFPRSYGARWLMQWAYRKYSPDPLQFALQTYFKELRLADSRTRLLITSYDLGADEVYLFRTPHHPRLRTDYKVPAWKVGLATSAAPTFFPASRHVNKLRLIDGGVWANNPMMLAIIEAYCTLGVPMTSIAALSIGTSDPMTQRRHRLDWGGILPWAIGNAAIDIIMRGQSLAATNHSRFLLGNDRFERVNPGVAAGEFTLDGVEKADDLIGKAAHYGRKFLGDFKSKFTPHKALKYTPLYR